MNLLENLLKPGPDPQAEQKIYTTSFYGQEFTALPELLKKLDAILIDIRFMPGGMPIKWSKEYLQLLLKRKYLHVPNLGNRIGRGSGGIAIQNLDLGLKIIRELRVDLLLMCECEKEETCHRRKIAEKLREQGLEAREIFDWKNPQ